MVCRALLALPLTVRIDAPLAIGRAAGRRQAARSGRLGRAITSASAGAASTWKAASACSAIATKSAAPGRPTSTTARFATPRPASRPCGARRPIAKTKDLAGEVQLLMGDTRAQRFLKRSTTYGKADLLSVVATLRPRHAGPAGIDRQSALGRQDIRPGLCRLPHDGRRSRDARLFGHRARLLRLPRRRARRITPATPS